jgi:hypothetical protein
MDAGIEIKVGVRPELDEVSAFGRDSVNSKATSSCGLLAAPPKTWPAGPVDDAATRVLIPIDTAAELHC